MTELAADPFRTRRAGRCDPQRLRRPYYLDDRKLRISIARVDGRLYAFDDLCTCADEPCPLSGGLLTGTTIMCQCHGSRFDITTGAVINGPATEALNVYEVQEVDGEPSNPRVRDEAQDDGRFRDAHRPAGRARAVRGDLPPRP